MPSASTKVETKPSTEGLEPIKQVLVLLDKKIRNLEKRKVKLDQVKQKKDKGVKLEKDQQAALDHYGAVVGNLEFARELQKLYNGISMDAEKLARRYAKREKIERHAQDTKRVRDVLHIQGLLDSLGSESVRSDFQTGKHGAVVLTEENLNHFDELYKLISPSRENEGEYETALSEASTHIMNLMDAVEKPVVGTTYKELKELMDLIAGCGYFEKVPETEEDAGKETQEELGGADTQEVAEGGDAQLSLTADAPVHSESLLTPSQLNNDLDPQTVQQTNVTSITAEADSFFSASNTANVVQQQQQQQQQQEAEFQRQRPFQEIVSSVQGNFNFLQESTIDMESPHMDPAVVAAHPMPAAPMPRPPSTQTSESNLQNAGFGANTFGEQPSVESDSTSAEQMSSLLSQTQSVNTVQQNPDFSSSNFGQSSLTQGLQSDTLFSSQMDKSSVNISHSVLGQSTSDSTISQFEIPPSIPMPPGHEQSQEQSQSEKKPFIMNPNAGEFQSLLFPQSEAGGEEGGKNDMSNDQTGFQGGSYSGGFQQQQSYNQNQRSGGRGGGYRGDGRVRGNRGNNMSNGFSQRGRGGNSNYGGNNYQGYPPRNDYKPDGYQGYGGGRFNSNSSDYQRRGGPPRGGNRGGMRGNFNRGGPRGGGRGNSNSGGGFGRPNFNQQQPVAQQ